MAPAQRAAVAEFMGTAALLSVVVGSGIMAERLAGGNAAIALLANALATGFALYVLITVLAPYRTRISIRLLRWRPSSTVS